MLNVFSCTWIRCRVWRVDRSLLLLLVFLNNFCLCGCTICIWVWVVWGWFCCCSIGSVFWIRGVAFFLGFGRLGGRTSRSFTLFRARFWVLFWSGVYPWGRPFYYSSFYLSINISVVDGVAAIKLLFGSNPLKLVREEGRGKRVDCFCRCFKYGCLKFLDVFSWYKLWFRFFYLIIKKKWRILVRLWLLILSSVIRYPLKTIFWVLRCLSRIIRLPSGPPRQALNLRNIHR